MGLSGMENSPAAAALAAEAADDATRAITDAYRDTRLRVSALNREQARLDTDLATRIAIQRHAVQSGNADELRAMRGDIAATLDALYSRDRTMELMREQIDAADDDGGWLDYVDAGANVFRGITGGLQGWDDVFDSQGQEDDAGMPSDVFFK